MGFRFYTPRLVVSSLNNVSVTYSRTNSPAYCRQGSCTTSHGIDDRSFYVNFYMYRNAYYMSQWHYWSSGEYFDLTFNFNSVGEDGDSIANPDQIFVTGTLVWETSRYHSSDSGKCGCNYPHYSCSRTCSRTAYRDYWPYASYTQYFSCCANRDN
jgi:hypothetical protein